MGKLRQGKLGTMMARAKAQYRERDEEMRARRLAEFERAREQRREREEWERQAQRTAAANKALGRNLSLGSRAVERIADTVAIAATFSKQEMEETESMRARSARMGRAHPGYSVQSLMGNGQWGAWSADAWDQAVGPAAIQITSPYGVQQAQQGGVAVPALPIHAIANGIAVIRRSNPEPDTSDLSVDGIIADVLRQINGGEVPAPPTEAEVLALARRAQEMAEARRTSRPLTATDIFAVTSKVYQDYRTAMLGTLLAPSKPATESATRDRSLALKSLTTALAKLRP